MLWHMMRNGRSLSLFLTLLLLLSGGFAFHTYQFHQSIQIIPAPNGTLVSTNATIRVLFEHPLTYVPPSAIELTPEGAGTTILAGELTAYSHSLTFVPNSPLQENTVYEIRLKNGIETENGRLRFPLTSQFSTTGQQILYLTPHSSEAGRQIEHHQQGLISEPSHSISEFTASPDGTLLAYLIADDEIWVQTIDGRFRHHLHTCAPHHCGQLAWTNDGTHLLFDHRAQETPNAPQIWSVNIASAQANPLLPNNPTISSGAQSNGAWLSYLTSTDIGLIAQQTQTGEQVRFATQISSIAKWHPNGRWLAFSDQTVVVLHRGDEADHSAHDHLYQDAIHLYLGDVTTGEREQLTDTAAIDDSFPVWSPDGDWLIFGRRLVQTNTGRQLWRIRPDGTQATPLTDNFLHHHHGVAWSPNGRFILYQQSLIEQPNQPPSLWQMEIETGEAIQLTPVGWQPIWLP